MIPEDIKQTLHDLRVIGGGHEVYESGNDQEMLQNFMASKGLSFQDKADTDWEAIRHMLNQEKAKMKKEMDDYYRAFMW